ncbi:MAG TPA: protease HtpX [Polyangiaceae bacterium]
MFKRVALLILTNLAIVLVLGVIINVLGALGVFHGVFMQNYGALLVISAVMGFGGAFISLLISKPMAKWSTGAQVISMPRNDTEAWLLDTVSRLAARAGIAMPEVAIYDSEDMNAFATGATRNSALVAVSSGILARMNRPELEAVLGHELTHVTNGDMVTLTLLQGVLNTFVFFLARVIGTLVDSALSGRDRDRRGGGIGYFMTVMFAQIVLGLLASFVVAWFSRRREYRADAGGAGLGSRDGMISALRRLGQSEETGLPKTMAAFGINGGGMLGLLRSHPPIEDRIAALQSGAR